MAYATPLEHFVHQKTCISEVCNHLIYHITRDFLVQSKMSKGITAKNQKRSCKNKIGPMLPNNGRKLFFIQTQPRYYKSYLGRHNTWWYQGIPTNIKLQVQVVFKRRHTNNAQIIDIQANSYFTRTIKRDTLRKITTISPHD